MKQWIINQFHGGNAIDEKLGLKNQFANTSKGIDSYYKPSVLRGNLKMEVVETGAVTAKMQYFVKGSDGITYGYGYLLFGGANTYMTLWKLTGTTWSAAGTASASAPVEDSQVVEYKDHLVGYSQNQKLFTYGLLSGTPSFTEDFLSGGTALANAITKNGPLAVTKNVLFGANGNIIWSLTDPTDNSTFTQAAFTLPSGWLIVSMVPWGDYMALGVRLPGGQESRLIIWDTSDATQWEFSKKNPKGELVGIRNVGDIIRGIVVNKASDADHVGSIDVIEWSGGAVRVVWRYSIAGLGKTTTMFRNNALDEKDGILYAGWITANNVGGIFTYGQPLPNGKFAFNHAFSMNTTTLQQLSCIKWIGTFLYSSIYDNTGTDYQIVRSDDAANAYEDLQYDSRIFDGYGKLYIEKEIKKIIVNCNSLPANGVITLKYKVDRASSWTTIGTITIAGTKEQIFEVVNGLPFDNFKELQLQVGTNMSAGEGLIEITGITVLYNELEIPA